MSREPECGTPADIGVLAAIGVAVCCGLPLLIGAGTLATVGAFLRSPLVIAAGFAALGGFGWRTFARRRGRHLAGDRPLPRTRRQRSRDHDDPQRAALVVGGRPTHEPAPAAV